jgi:hypothetical protein
MLTGKDINWKTYPTYVFTYDLMVSDRDILLLWGDVATHSHFASHTHSYTLPDAQRSLYSMELGG